MTKLIFVNRFYYPDVSATSQMLTDAAEYLAAKHDVHVVTSRLPYEGDVHFPPEEVHKGVKIHRIWTTSFGRGNLFGRSFDYLTFYVGVFFRLLVMASKRDLLIAKTDPPMVSIPVSWAASFKGARLVNWLQDLFPEVATALGMNLPSLLVSCLRWLRNVSLHRAVVNLTIGDAMRNRLLKEGVYTDRLVVVPNWSDGDAIVPARSDALRREWQLNDHFVVGYSGNFGRAHEFTTLALGIERLQSEEGIRFLMVGGGIFMEALEAKGFSNCLFKPYQPRERLPQTLTLPDVHLISLQPKLEGLILPSKVYGVLAAGKPIINIGDPQGEVGSLVTESGVGFNVPPGDSDELVRVILHLSSHREDVSRKGQAARALFDERFGQERSLRTLEEVLCQQIP